MVQLGKEGKIHDKAQINCSTAGNLASNGDLDVPVAKNTFVLRYTFEGAFRQMRLGGKANLCSNIMNNRADFTFLNKYCAIVRIRF